MPLPRDISGKATRSPGLINTGFYESGDYVVPEFTEGGTKSAPGQVLGDAADVMGLAKKMAVHAEMGGATPLPPTKPGKTSKPAKVKKALPRPRAPQLERDPVLKVDGLVMQPPVEAQDTNPILSRSPSIQTSSPIEVVFSTQLGRIKLNAAAVLDSTNALVVVFANEGEIRYEPAPGAEVQLIIDGKLEKTMYPGFKFEWTDNRTVLMVFVKLPED